jgi:hypothetical protein
MTDVPGRNSSLDAETYVRENRGLLVRVLRHGDTEARAYALALLANAGDSRDVERVREQLDEIQ